jgi:drug/metabolite transporter (DMT)-like permease
VSELARHTGGVTQRHGWWWCVAAAVLFGAATPATKAVLDEGGSPVSLAGLLYLGAALAVAPFADLGRAPVARHGQRRKLMVAVALGGGIAPVLLVLALDRTPASTVSLLLNLELVATVIIARVFLHEHIGRRAAIGVVAVASAGVVLAGASGATFAVGALLVACTCVCWGVDNAITASLDGYSPARITFTKGVVAGSVNLVLGIAIDGLPTWRFVAGALVIGALGYGVSITLWITGARLVGAARGQVVFALAPFIGAVLSWLVLGESLSGSFAVAFALSLAGVLLVATGHHGHVHHHEPLEHAHAIDPADPHHAAGAVEVLDGQRHRHLALTHDHEHLPDIHHRHVH